ncbi:cobalt ECF transporter T component CbiQ [Oceanidesulfovibrio indonesiensis]|uniref:Cobalt ECF transporter T component CbiQ n=1 Tax=Oceanidesulfovibrio indonesiensis TaxID=54767 RepID=A0A7M3MII9_9BACT|nr:cobalt ECF transporter T component CbiQ [Oceanidesulfovibrio indonesiensis]TVM19508.1 cobalt ECF transporter T component CbiQ [Oceanidesulfovibrio indonesiensis]
MIRERFALGDSFLHRLDPRAGLVSAVSLSVVLALVQGFPAAGAGLVLGCGLVLAARLDIGEVLRRLLVVNSFIAFIWLLVPLTYGGEPLFSFGFLHISREGVRLAALITLKSNGIVLVLMSLVATSTLVDMGRAMESLGVPSRLCRLLLYTVRYLTVIEDEYRRLARAAGLRGFAPRLNLHTCRTYGHMIAMTMVRSYNRARRVQQAMQLRGFTGRFVSMHVFSAGYGDVCFAAGSVIAAAGLAVIEFAS